MGRSRPRAETDARPPGAGRRHGDLFRDRARPERQCRADRDGRGRGRCRRGGRGRGGAEETGGAGRQERDRGALERRGRWQRHVPRDQFGRRRHRELRLGVDAGADVCPLGRKEGLQGRAAIRDAGRRGWDQVGGLQDLGAERLWLAEIGIGRAPAGADLAVRFVGPAAHVLLVGLGLPGGRRRYRDRGQSVRDPARHLPLVRRRRAAREHHRFGGPDHPHPDRDRGHELREIAAPEPRHRHEGAEIAALPDGAGPAERRDHRGARGQGRCRLGQPDPVLRAAALPDGEGPAHRLRDQRYPRCA